MNPRSRTVWRQEVSPVRVRPLHVPAPRAGPLLPRTQHVRLLSSSGGRGARARRPSPECGASSPGSFRDAEHASVRPAALASAPTRGFSDSTKAAPCDRPPCQEGRAERVVWRCSLLYFPGCDVLLIPAAPSSRSVLGTRAHAMRAAQVVPPCPSRVSARSALSLKRRETALRRRDRRRHRALGGRGGRRWDERGVSLACSSASRFRNHALAAFVPHYIVGERTQRCLSSISGLTGERAAREHRTARVTAECIRNTSSRPVNVSARAPGCTM